MVMSSPNPVGQVPEPPVNMRRSLSSAMHSVGLQVDRDNVLRVRSVLLTEAEKLLDAVTRPMSERPWVDLCGADPVSGEASSAFNARIQILVDHCRQYALQLEQAANSLDRIARNYGYTEAEIQASLKGSALR
ncbi:MAG: hypothetical protein QOI50_5737 [Pseudonocardiales bacterium]|nr:hypothetical protein [Pseudonocardiales bacterium]